MVVAVLEDEVVEAFEAIRSQTSGVVTLSDSVFEKSSYLRSWTSDDHNIPHAITFVAGEAYPFKGIQRKLGLSDVSLFDLRRSLGCRTLSLADATQIDEGWSLSFNGMQLSIDAQNMVYHITGV